MVMAIYWYRERTIVSSLIYRHRHSVLVRPRQLLVAVRHKMQFHAASLVPSSNIVYPTETSFLAFYSSVSGVSG